MFDYQVIISQSISSGFKQILCKDGTGKDENGHSLLISWFQLGLTQSSQVSSI